MPAITDVSASRDAYVNGILGSSQWAVTNLTYSFPSDGAFYGTSYGTQENSTGFAAFNAVQQAATRAALANYAAVANLHFTEVAETASQHGDLRYAMSTLPGTAHAYLPSPAAEGGDVWVNAVNSAYKTPAAGNYGYTTLLHESGHALGLDHPQDGVIMPSDRDSTEYTLMSYRSYVGSPTTSLVNETSGFPESLMIYDIAAVQSMYGANFGFNAGATTYGWSPTTGEEFINGVGQGAPVANRIYETIWDGGGVDTYDFSNYTTALSVDLSPGAWSTVSLAEVARTSYDGLHLAPGSIANPLLSSGDLRSLIENVVGGHGDDVVRGNQVANVLTGGAGDDVLDGAAGVDTATYSGNRASYAINRTLQGDETISGGQDGADTLTRVEWAQFSDAKVWIGVQGNDHNGDGRSDVFWQNTSGQAAIWNSNGTGGFAGLDLGNPGAAWQIKETGDYNGDGLSDILWQNTSGQGYIWDANATGGWSGVDLGNYGAAWQIKGSGDFNGDGLSDILWQNTNGQGSIWEANASGAWSGVDLGNPGAAWQIKDTGDFNGDGLSDILWQNTSGQGYIWEANPTGGWSGVDLFNPGVAWQIKDTGDFDADGRSDILWQNTSGQGYIWEANATGGWSGVDLGNYGAAWQIKGTGDFNGDGRSDIVWQNTNGQGSIWEANGTSGWSGVDLGNPGADWHMIV